MHTYFLSMIINNNIVRRDSGKRYLRIAILIFIILFSTLLISLFRQKGSSVKASSDQAFSSDSQKALPGFTQEELKKYDGTDPNLPIYLALDGNVYDVTKGKEFYEVGGSYHSLAGKDSSLELNIVGGDIIKRKYPVIGRLIKAN